MPNEFLSRDCPLCKRPSPATPEFASTTRAESMTFQELESHWTGFYKDKPFFSYFRCDGCGLLYAPTFFTAGQLEKLYSRMPPNMSLVPVSALRKTQKKYFETLRRHSPLTGNYVEVGPDIGLFTENCVRDGHFDHYWLFEPNTSIEGELKATMKDKSFRILNEMFGFSQIPDGSAGAIVMIHVLDHLLDPAITLRELHPKMANGATLSIITHDESSVLRKIFGHRWPAFCLQHPELYSRKSIRALLDSEGFDVIAIERTTNYFPLQFVLKQLVWACGYNADWVPSFWGKMIGVPIIGNIMTIATPRKSPTRTQA